MEVSHRRLLLARMSCCAYTSIPQTENKTSRPSTSRGSRACCMYWTSAFLTDFRTSRNVDCHLSSKHCSCTSANLMPTLTQVARQCSAWRGWRCLPEQKGSWSTRYFANFQTGVTYHHAVVILIGCSAIYAPCLIQAELGRAPPAVPVTRYDGLTYPLIFFLWGSGGGSDHSTETFPLLAPPWQLAPQGLASVSAQRSPYLDPGRAPPAVQVTRQ